MKSILLALALLTASFSTSFAANRITFNPGGSVQEFIINYNDARQAEGKFIIDGPCISACTLITGLVDNDKVCATWRGVLGFHTPYFETPTGPIHAVEATRLMGQMYPEKVKSILKTKGLDFDSGEQHSDLVYIRGTELYKLCD